MMDNLDPRESAPEAAPYTGAEEQAVTDREVALPTARTAPAVHAWLDGEASAEQALQAAPKDVAFWQAMGSEADQRRRMTTPAHVPAAIMAKLGDAAR